MSDDIEDIEKYTEINRKNLDAMSEEEVEQLYKEVRENVKAAVEMHGLDWKIMGTPDEYVPNDE